MPSISNSSGERELYRLNFRSDFALISRVCSEVRSLAIRRAGRAWSDELDLGLTEALTNVARHGYGRDRQGSIDLRCLELDNSWLLRLTDSARPIPGAALDRLNSDFFDFDPANLSAIPEGGMGLRVIQKCFDAVQYRRSGEQNQLILKKVLPAFSAGPYKRARSTPDPFER
jgi:serine/threonine-protein kinase RsbW